MQKMRAALYVRVSTDGQTVENQIQALEQVAARNGWCIVATYKDEGISGAKGRDKRPGLAALYKGIARREFDVVMAWSVDRLGRSLKDLLCFLEELQAKGMDLYLHQQGLDTSTPAGKALFSMLGVFAEFERAMIVDRVKAGMVRAKREGKHVGRPSLDAEKQRRIVALRAEGQSYAKIAGTVGCSKGYVGKLLGASC